jgi:hypothetical protein
MNGAIAGRFIAATADRLANKSGGGYHPYQS